jgi:glycosyltransferase involved in cell wall biosynthesis
VCKPSVAGTRPHVLFAITLAEVGGAQSYVRELLPALAGEFEVTVAAGGDGPLRTATEAAGQRFVELRHMRRSISPLHDVLGVLELVRLFRRLRPDIVHVNSSKAGVLGRLAGALARVPVRVFTVHGWGFKAFDGVARRVYLWADRLVRPLTTVVICVSRADLELGLRARTCTVERTVVIENAVDPTPFRRATRDGGPLQIVSVGRLKAPKDFVTLVRAVALVEGVHLTVVGDGPDRPILERAVQTAGIGGRVDFAGESHDLPAVFESADVFVLSSRSEGMPVSVLEAMSASLPVVATGVGGVPEIVTDGVTGLVVPPGDPTALAFALGRLSSDAELRRRLGEHGRLRVEREFSLERFWDRHVTLYRSLLATGSPETA